MIVFRTFSAVIAAVFVFPATMHAAMVTGSPGNDFLFFQGTSTIVSDLTITSPSDFETTVSGTFYVNSATYDGLTGFDTLILSPDNDMLALDDVANVDRILAGDGDDVIYSGSVAHGDMIVEGADGNDIIFASTGNDSLNGRDGNDLIDGGPGNDIISGGLGDDTIIASLGHDLVDGGLGTDTLLFHDESLYSILGVSTLFNWNGPAVHSGCTDPDALVVSFLFSNQPSSACTINVDLFGLGSSVFTQSEFAATYSGEGATAVPLPASGWLFVSGLAMLGGGRMLRGRRQRW